MPVKISKIARELNVGVNTAAEFLQKHGVEVDGNPNARIDDAAVELLYKEYSTDKVDKDKSQLRTSRRAAKPARQESAEVKTASTRPAGPKVLGTIDLSSVGKGNVEVKPQSSPAAAQPAPTEKKAEPKPAPEAEKPAAAPRKPEAAPKAEVAAPAPAKVQKEVKVEK